MPRPGPAGLLKKNLHPRCAQVVFFFAKSCPSARRVQVRLLTKSHPRLQAEGDIKSKMDMDRQKSRAPPGTAEHPDKYDMLMDIATEEFSHLEIVGATIQMLLKGVNGELKDAADHSEIMQVMNGKAAKESIIHQALTANPQFGIITGGGVTPRNSQGIPWCASYIHSMAT
jgi:hypothetical protein